MFTYRLLRGCHAVCRVTVAALYPRHVTPLISRQRPHYAPGLRTLWCSTPCRKARNTGHWDGGGNGQGSCGEEEEEDEEVKELLVSQATKIHGAQTIFIVHPDVKWGPKKQRDTTANKTACLTHQFSKKFCHIEPCGQPTYMENIELAKEKIQAPKQS